MSFLTEIITRKRERLDSAKENVPLEQIRDFAMEARSSSVPYRLSKTLQQDGLHIIAEFKRKSPSKGVIRVDVDAGSMAQSYQAGGAAAISVLTEEKYFDGSLDDLRTVKAVVEVPVLRKDFVFDEYQLYESATAGADAILLIVAALDDGSLKALRRVAEDELGMDALVEVHDEVEMNRAAAAGARLIGVNNRNLHTFEVSLATSMELASTAPSGSVMVSESGLRSADDLVRLRHVGYRGFLIGESLMRAQNPVETLRALMGSPLAKV